MCGGRLRTFCTHKSVLSWILSVSFFSFDTLPTTSTLFNRWRLRTMISNDARGFSEFQYHSSNNIDIIQPMKATNYDFQWCSWVFLSSNISSSGIFVVTKVTMFFIQIGHKYKSYCTWITICSKHNITTILNQYNWLALSIRNKESLYLYRWHFHYRR